MKFRELLKSHHFDVKGIEYLEIVDIQNGFRYKMPLDSNVEFECFKTTLDDINFIKLKCARNVSKPHLIFSYDLFEDSLINYFRFCLSRFAGEESFNSMHKFVDSCFSCALESVKDFPDLYGLSQNKEN